MIKNKDYFEADKISKVYLNGTNVYKNACITFINQPETVAEMLNLIFGKRKYQYGDIDFNLYLEDCNTMNFFTVGLTQGKENIRFIYCDHTDKELMKELKSIQNIYGFTIRKKSAQYFGRIKSKNIILI
jgi:hypothetical protein